MSEYRDFNDNPCTLDALCAAEPDWAANHIRVLLANDKDLHMHLRRVLDAVHNDTGAEPSVSVLGRATDEAEEYLASVSEGQATDG